MKWTLKQNGSILVDENDNPVCTFPEGTDSFNKALIKYAPQMFDALMYYEQCYETVPPKTPKKVFNEVKKILDLIRDSSE